jgi:hypothetical protein
MPNARFYMRNNFRMPNLDVEAFRLTIGGLVNGRNVHDPRSPEHEIEDAGRHAGVCRQWQVILRSAHRGREMGIGRCKYCGMDWCAACRDPGPRRRAAEREGGYCFGVPTVARRIACLPRSASSAVYRSTMREDSDVLLAYAMNGEPLPVEHGYPLRLIVRAGTPWRRSSG